MTKEWNSRIQMWIRTLKKHLYRPVHSMQFTYCTTMEHWDYETAMQADYLPIREGDPWGREWEYAWFQTNFRLGDWAAGKRIVMDLDLGGEATLFLNGSVFGACRADWVSEPYHFLCDNYLTAQSQGNEEIHLVAECYAGHERPAENGEATAGPVGYGYRWKRPESAARTRLGTCTFGVWNEEAYHLLLEIQALYDIWENAGQDSLRVADIGEALQEFTMLVDYSLEENAFQSCLKECRSFLKPYLACTNGSTVPQMHAIGHAHIDLEWFWPIEETERKCARTMAAQIRHMEEYPEYKMLLSQPALYEMIRKYYPELYVKLKEKAQNGQLIPEGGMWAEADTNIPSGESLIRQFLYGKKYFREEFGADNEILWLPDVFGYCAALPQIMKGCGIKYFATAKIFWTYNGGEQFPYHYFEWKGLDGTKIPSFIHVDYNSKTDAAALIGKWKGRRRTESIKRMLVSVGYGDGGGGACRDHIENVRLFQNCEGVPSIFFDHPSHVFQKLKKEQRHTPEYAGELYFQAHRGTYTSQALLKKNNRKCELALREAELWNAFADSSGLRSCPPAAFEEQWKVLLKNQFHDILPGSSIHKVYTHVNKELENVILFAQNQTDAAAKALLGHDTGESALTLFNSLSWDRTAPIRLHDGWQGAQTRNGNILDGQLTKQGLFVQAAIPALGTLTLYPAALPESEPTVFYREKTMENEYLRITFNDYGEISSLYDKESQTQWAAGPLNAMKLYQDIPSHYEAWDLESIRREAVPRTEEKAALTLEEEGPLFCEIKVVKKLNQSTLTQWIRLEKASRKVTFRTRIDWQETQKFLKVNFPVTVTADEMLSEIQFGHVKRPNHTSREYDRDRFEVCNHKWSALIEANRGFALINDCKYGISCRDNTMELTLLKSAVFPDETADKGIQEFTYAFTLWNTPFVSSRVVQDAYELNINILNCRGSRADGSLLMIDRGNIIIDSVKRAEHTENAIVVRMYESMGSSTRAALHVNVPFDECLETDMLEEHPKPLTKDLSSIALSFHAFEVKTLIMK